MRESFAAAIAAAPSRACETGHSMFDCPLAIHTSPTRRSRSTTLSEPERTVSVCGPPAGRAGKVTFHAPDPSAVAVRVCRSSDAEMEAPGALHPQTGMVVWRWSTIPVEKILASRSVAVGGAVWAWASAAP